MCSATEPRTWHVRCSRESGQEKSAAQRPETMQMRELVHVVNAAHGFKSLYCNALLRIESSNGGTSVRHSSRLNRKGDELMRRAPMQSAIAGMAAILPSCGSPPLAEPPTNEVTAKPS